MQYKTKKKRNQNMALKGKKPVLETLVKPKSKLMLSGKSGSGKTMFGLDFPKPYLIDVEGGAVELEYQSKIVKNGGAYMGKLEGSQDFDTVIKEIKALMTEKHDFQTLIIDSFTKLYLMAAAIAEEKIGSDFGKDRKEANRPTRQLMRWLDKIDMNVILICHQKDKWERKGSEIFCSGTTFDGYDKLEYELDLWIEIGKNKGNRFFSVKKSRLKNFIEGDVYDLSYQKFSELYGREAIEEKVKPLELAKPDQIQKLNSLLEVVKVEEDFLPKCLKKADADCIEELTEEQILKLVGFLEAKVKVN
jgi:hypothetical protein